MFIYTRGHLGSCASLTYISLRLRSDKQVSLDSVTMCRVSNGREATQFIFIDPTEEYLFYMFMIWTRLKVFTLMGNWFCDVLDRVSSSLYYVYDQGKGTPGVISGIYTENQSSAFDFHFRSVLMVVKLVDLPPRCEMFTSVYYNWQTTR